MRPRSGTQRSAREAGSGHRPAPTTGSIGIALVIPFLLADAILGWMLWHGWQRHEVLGTRLNRTGDDRAAYWLSFGRLALLFTLSIVGTIAAWRAA